MALLLLLMLVAMHWRPVTYECSTAFSNMTTTDDMISITASIDEGKNVEFVNLIDLACAKYEGRVLFATDEWFAVADNMLKDTPAKWDADRFTDCGKWMDGWESRRKRTPGYDWCIIKLGIPGELVGITVDTSHFTGNYAPSVSIWAAALNDIESNDELLPQRSVDGGIMGTIASPDELAMAEKFGEGKWVNLVEMQTLAPGRPDTCCTYINLPKNSTTFTHLKFAMLPDGGVARLHVYGNVHTTHAKRLALDNGKFAVDLISILNGGDVVAFSDAHFGHPRNLITPNRALGMYDGWETARKPNRGPILKADDAGMLILKGNDWAILKLGISGIIENVEIDTNHFKGNFPESCRLDACFTSKDTVFHSDGTSSEEISWFPVIPRFKLEGHTTVFRSAHVNAVNIVATHVKLTIFPDGGISRLRVFGSSQI